MEDLKLVDKLKSKVKEILNVFKWFGIYLYRLFGYKAYCIGESVPIRWGCRR